LNISQSKYNRSVSRKSYKTAKRSQISKTSNSSVAISTKSWKEEANEDIEEHGNLEHYFGGKHTDFILKYRWIIVAVLTCMTGFSVYLCTNIHGLTKMELYFSERHPLYTAFNKAVYGFQKGVQS
jgi:predicted RND superfamily exporter protein